MKRKYSFLQEDGVWGTAARAVNGIARSGYINNAARGAAAGATIGAVGGVAKNAMKRDDDPTKRGVLGSAFGGAATGATMGAVGGVAARGIAGRSFAKGGIAKLNHMAAKEAAVGLKGQDAVNAYANAHRGLGNAVEVNGNNVRTTVNVGRHMNKGHGLFGGNETKTLSTTID